MQAPLAIFAQPAATQNSAVLCATCATEMQTQSPEAPLRAVSAIRGTPEMVIQLARSAVQRETVPVNRTILAIHETLADVKNVPTTPFRLPEVPT
jgi:hypothetical protein